jgi:xanthine dehydrogenase accessory factor
LVSHDVLTELMAATAQERPVALVTVVAGPTAGGKALVSPSAVTGSLGDAALERAAIADARAMLAQGASGTRHYGLSGEQRGVQVEVFIQSFASPPRMYVFGAIDFSRATVRVGKLLGYHVTVVDARSTFATTKRFPEADEVVVAWPHEFLESAAIDARTVLCILTHDPKFDVPVLAAAVQTPAAYIGAMGSRRTHTDRIRRLREEGVAERDLDRIQGPIGLDIGARTPEEVAVAIAAEIIALHYGKEAPSLSHRSGPVHRPLAVAAEPEEATA